MQPKLTRYATETAASKCRPADQPGAVRPFSAVAVTMTLARNPTESKTLLASLRLLSQTGMPIYIGEGGSDDAFVEKLKQLPNVCVSPPEPGTKRTLVHQIRRAFAQAQESGAECFLYTEPDKRSFFRGGLHALVDTARPGYCSGPALAIAARDCRRFNTFPTGQRIAEKLMNRVCAEAIGQPGDYTYGPMLLSRPLLRYLRLIPEDAGWGWRFFMIAVTHQLRGRIDLCTVGSACPRAQRLEDGRAHRDYRLRQLQENVTGLANGWKCLLDTPVENRADLAAA